MMKRAPVICLALCLALVYGRYCIGFAPSGEDTVQQYIPYQKLAREAVRSGEAPLWNPMTFLGRPLMADIQVGVMYPPNWLHWILPLPVSFALVFLAHAAWMLAGCYRLGRAWQFEPPAAALMAALFAFSGFFTSKLLSGVIIFQQTMAWLPWCALAMTRLAEGATPRRFAALAGALAMSLLAGSPQMTFYAWITLALLPLMLARTGGEGGAGYAKSLAKLWGLFALALALAFILAAPQAFQTWQMIGQSFDRSAGASWEYITGGSLPPGALFSQLLYPGFFGPGQNEALSWGPLAFSESNAEFPRWALLLADAGIIVALCQAFISMRSQGRGSAAPKAELPARAIMFGAGLAALFALLAFGKHTVLYRLLFEAAPGFSSFRVPARAMAGASFGLAVAASGALHLVLNPKGGNERSQAGWLAALFIALGLVGLAGARLLVDRAWVSQLAPFMVEGRPAAEAARAEMERFTLVSLIRAGGAMAAAALILFAILKARGGEPGSFGWKPLLPWALPLLAALELGAASWPVQRATAIGKYEATQYPKTELVQLIEKSRTNGRVLYLDELIGWQLDQNQPEVLKNLLVMHGIPDARGYDPVNAKWIGTWMNRLAGLPPDRNPLGQMFVPRIELPAWLTLMGVELVLSYQDLSRMPGMALAGSIAFPEGPLGVWRNTNFRGLAFAAPGGPTLEDRGTSQAESAALALANPGAPLAALAYDRRMEGAPELSGGAVAPALDPAKFSVTPIREGPNRFEYRTSFAEPAVLFFSQSAYAGWRARVNGEEQTPAVACGTFLAVEVGAGQGDVVWEYRPPKGFGWAMALGAAGLIVLSVLTLMPRTTHHNGTKGAKVHNEENAPATS